MEADRVEQEAGAVEIDAVAFVEVGLGLAGDDGGEVEDEVGAVLDGLGGCAGRRQVEGGTVEFAGEAGGCGGLDDVDQGQAVGRPVAHQAFGQLAADHAGGADDQDVRHWLPSRSSIG